MRVLVIEDEADIREIVCEFLSILDVDYLSASNGKEAFEIIEKENFDIVFTDLKLPDINGMKIIEKIKESDTNTFLAVISGFCEEMIKEKAFRAGVDYYIEKPFSFKEISEVLELARQKKN